MTQDQSNRSIVEHEGGHLRVLGPAASGKTALMLERFRWLESRGRNPAIIAYGREHRDRLVEALLPDGAARFGRVPVWTFPQLAGDILRRARPTARSPLGELEEHVLLDGVIEQASLRSDYGSLAGSDALREQLLSVIHTLLQNHVGPSVDTAGNDRLADIVALYRAYRERLLRSGNTTFYDVAWRAAAAIRQGGAHPLNGVDVVLVDDFNDVDAGQFELLLRLAPPDGTAEVNVFGDPSGARFRFRGTSEAFLNAYFPDLYRPRDVEIERAQSMDAPAPGQLGLFDAPAGPARRAVEVSGAAIAEDEIAEARWVVDRAQGLLRDGLAPEGVAVVVRDPRRYRNVLERAFDDAGVPFDAGADRTGPAEQMAVGLMRGLGSRETDLAEVLRDSPLYRRVFDAFAPALEMETCTQSLREAGRLAGHIRRSSFAGGKRFSMSRFMACMGAVFDQMSMGASERRRIDALRDAWYAYAEMTKHVGASPSPAGFLRFRRSGSSSRSKPRGGAIRMFTPRELAGRIFDAVILCGCAEGVFPMVESAPGYIPWSGLETLVATAAYPVTLQGSRTREQLLDDERVLFEAALMRARRYLYLSAPEKIDGEAAVAPSEMAMPAFEGAGRVARRDGLGERAARVVVDGFLTGGIDTAAEAAGRVEKLWLSPRPGVREFALEPFALSPSRLGTLEACERKFFYTRVLDLDRDESVPRQLGTWVHDALEELVAEGDDGDALRSRLDEDSIERIADGIAGKVSEGAAMARSVRTHVVAILAGLRRLESNRVPVERFEASEWRFEFEAEGCLFNGRADRVDRLSDGGIVVVDYKTGQVAATAKTVRSNIADPDRDPDKRDWQVALYSRAVESEYGEAPASFCYYHLQPGKDVSAIEIRLDGSDRSIAFASIDDKRVGSVDATDVAAVVSRGVALSRGLFSPKTWFARTEVRTRCRGCPFERVCERDE